VVSVLFGLSEVGEIEFGFAIGDKFLDFGFNEHAIHLIKLFSFLFGSS